MALLLLKTVDSPGWNPYGGPPRSTPAWAVAAHRSILRQRPFCRSRRPRQSLRLNIRPSAVRRLRPRQARLYRRLPLLVRRHPIPGHCQRVRKARSFRHPARSAPLMQRCLRHPDRALQARPLRPQDLVLSCHRPHALAQTRPNLGRFRLDNAHELGDQKRKIRCIALAATRAL